MHFPHELLHFLSMGGYAFYVWFAYGAVAVVLLGLCIHALIKRRQLFKQLRRLHQGKLDES